MARRKALLFTDAARFVDYVRLGSPKSVSTRGFELLEVTWPASGQRALLLLGHRARPWSLLQRLSRAVRGEPAETFTRVEVIITDEDLIWLDSGRQRPCTVHSRRGAHKLIELVELRPWHEAPEGVPVLFRSEDDTALERLALDSLALGNDRIQLAGLSDGSMLLKMESPSWFLLQRCLEEDSGVTLYAPMPGASGQAWLQWGWRHPLAVLWGAVLDPGQLVLFAPGRARQELATPDWQDLYDSAEVTLEVPTDPVLLQAAEVDHRFTITVHLAPRARPAAPELWLVDDAERGELERLLSALDDADLDDLLIAPLTGSGDRIRYLLRERHTGSGRKFIDFSPRAFSPWPSAPDLFIPAESTLLPHLRRDRYRGLFSLKPGHMSVLIGPDELVQLPYAAFGPLTRLVDYQITAEATRIESLLARNIFDFGPYASAPSRPELLKSRRKATPSRAVQTPVAPVTAEKKPRAAAADNTAEAPEPTPKAPALIAAPETLSELGRAEQTLEREIIEEPSATRWANLSLIKEQRGLLYAAWRSNIEAWWLSSSRVDEESHRRALDTLTTELGLTGSPSSQARQALQKNTLNSAMAYIMLGRQLPPGHIDSWVLQAGRLMGRFQDDLPKKIRWLAWGEVWKVNQDVRAQARVRTQLLADLDTAGLSPLDVPDFIQERLLKERSLTSDKDASEVNRALTNLEGIYTAVRSMPTDLRCGGMAVLARAYRRLGRLDRTQLCLEQARQESTSPFLTAWIRLFAEEAISLQNKSQINALLADLQSNNAEALRKVADSLRARQSEDDPLSFLSTDNLSRLYPSTPSLKRNPLYTQLERVALFRKKNQVQKFRQAMEGWLSEAINQSGAINNRDIATLVNMGVREISRMQANSSGGELVGGFRSFASKSMNRMGGRSDYFSLLFQLSLAQGLLDLNQTAHSFKIMKRAMANLQSADFITLDLVDTSAAAVQILESADLAQRGVALDGLLKALVSHSTRLPDLVSTTNTLNMLKLLDQLCEASVSKDRITLSRYRRYQDLDELQIRERVLTEDHCL